MYYDFAKTVRRKGATRETVTHLYLLIALSFYSISPASAGKLGGTDTMKDVVMGGVCKWEGVAKYSQIVVCVWESLEILGNASKYLICLEILGILWNFLEDLIGSTPPHLHPPH